MPARRILLLLLLLPPPLAAVVGLLETRNDLNNGFISCLSVFEPIAPAFEYVFIIGTSFGQNFLFRALSLRLNVFSGAECIEV